MKRTVIEVTIDDANGSMDINLVQGTVAEYFDGFAGVGEAIARMLVEKEKQTPQSISVGLMSVALHGISSGVCGDDYKEMPTGIN